MVASDTKGHGESEQMRSYVVRIYRNGKARRLQLAGTVEDVSAGLTSGFRGLRQLGRLLALPARRSAQDSYGRTGIVGMGTAREAKANITQRRSKRGKRRSVKSTA